MLVMQCLHLFHFGDLFLLPLVTIMLPPLLLQLLSFSIMFSEKTR